MSADPTEMGTQFDSTPPLPNHPKDQLEASYAPPPMSTSFGQAPLVSMSASRLVQARLLRARIGALHVAPRIKLVLFEFRFSRARCWQC